MLGYHSFREVILAPKLDACIGMWMFPHAHCKDPQKGRDMNYLDIHHSRVILIDLSGSCDFWCFKLHKVTQFWHSIYVTLKSGLGCLAAKLCCPFPR
jgi:hypothetical protein